MAWLLNTVYLGLLAIFAPRLIWLAWRRGKYRQGWPEKLWGAVPHHDARPRIWLHAVSVGEVQLLQPIINHLRQLRPELDLVISTTTQTGIQLARHRYGPSAVFFAPLDFSWSVRRALHRIRPSLLVLVELELWPNLVAAAWQMEIPVAIVNGRLGERSACGYRYLRPIIAKTLQRITWIGAQDSTIAARFQSLGARPEHLTVTGSVKFDGAETDRLNARTLQLARLAGLREDDQVWVVGSTQDPEERLALQVFDRLARRFPQLKLLLVPRHPDRFSAVVQLAAQSGWSYSQRSQLGESKPDAAPRILVVDTIGELSAWWGTATIGFVGGSLTPRGGQNMIEPAAYGVALSFGPHTHNFRDVVALLDKRDACVIVRDASDMERFVERCLTDEPFRKALADRAQRVVQEQRGATQRTVERLVGLVPSADVPPRPHFLRRHTAAHPTAAHAISAQGRPGIISGIPIRHQSGSEGDRQSQSTRSDY